MTVARGRFYAKGHLVVHDLNVLESARKPIVQWFRNKFKWQRQQASSENSLIHFRMSTKSDCWAAGREFIRTSSRYRKVSMTFRFFVCLNFLLSFLVSVSPLPQYLLPSVFIETSERKKKQKNLVAWTDGLVIDFKLLKMLVVGLTIESSCPPRCPQQKPPRADFPPLRKIESTFEDKNV